MSIYQTAKNMTASELDAEYESGRYNTREKLWITKFQILRALEVCEDEQEIEYLNNDYAEIMSLL